MMRASMEENPFLKSMVPKITATGTLTSAADVAAAAVFLCSPAAAGVSGVSLVVDEGQLAR